MISSSASGSCHWRCPMVSSPNINRILSNIRVDDLSLFLDAEVLSINHTCVNHATGACVLGISILDETGDVQSAEAVVRLEHWVLVGADLHEEGYF